MVNQKIDELSYLHYGAGMIDTKQLLEDPETILAAIGRRTGQDTQAKRLTYLFELLTKQKAIRTTLQEFREAQNVNADKMAMARTEFLEVSDAAIGYDTIAGLIEDGKQLKESVALLADEDVQIAQSIEEIVSWAPNPLHSSVPDGKSEEDNVVVKTWGDPQLKIVPHYEFTSVGYARDRSHKIASGRFVTLSGDLARLHRAVGQYMLDHHADWGYQEVNPPLIVDRKSLYNTGQLPKFEDDLYKLADGLGVHTQYLAPTSEVMLTNLVSDTMLVEEELPARYTALTKCFRKEAGSAGRDTRGLIRLNEFEKVELVSVVYPDKGELELERMTECAESVLENLELPYRRILLCGADTGFSAAKTYDLEVWMAGSGKYREISSCSLCTDFQARRANIKVRLPNKGKKVLAHTLNGSALAVGRTVAALIENNHARNRMTIPEVLLPYLRGTTVIELG